MAKVRVPKHLRPPERFDSFPCHDCDPRSQYYGSFRCAGKFREPKQGEFYWGECGSSMAVLWRVDAHLRTGPRVILEKVSNQ